MFVFGIFVFRVEIKKQTVPDIKRRKSAFCSRCGTGRGPESYRLSVLMIHFRGYNVASLSRGKGVIFISIFVNAGADFTGHTHTHALSEISAACKQ